MLFSLYVLASFLGNGRVAGNPTQSRGKVDERGQKRNKIVGNRQNPVFHAKIAILDQDEFRLPVTIRMRQDGLGAFRKIRSDFWTPFRKIRSNFWSSFRKIRSDFFSFFSRLNHVLKDFSRIQTPRFPRSRNTWGILPKATSRRYSGMWRGYPRGNTGLRSSTGNKDGTKDTKKRKGRFLHAF